ncbi:MAG TPA: hypothetical protein VGL73_09260 [Caulobacteraceae bacterium]|jgi:hypothetical protein
MIRVWKGRGAWRGVALTLAALVLALKIAVPPGFMIADAGAPVPIAICTGHGPLMLDHGDGKSPNAPMHKTDAPCTGAGNVTPLSTPLADGAAALYVWAATVPGAGPALDAAPGRGLAAPPPPSHAPPALIS